MSERAKTIWTILGVMAFIWVGLDFYKAGGLLRERGKYTIGYVRGTHWAVKSGKQVDFYITVNGQTYRGGADELPGMKIKGGRYLVKYDSLDLQTKGVYYQYAIPDSIGEAPANGWREPPFQVPAEVISCR